MIQQEKYLHWKKLFLLQITEEMKRAKLSSSKLNEKEEQSTKLNIRNFNMDGMGKFQSENFKKEKK